MVLRNYQEEIKGRLYAAWEAGSRSVMCQMPTGTGKTVVLAEVIKEKTAGPSQSLRDSSPSMGSSWRDERTCRVLVVAHRREILAQIRETLVKFGLGDRLEDGSVVVESIQKLSRGLVTDGKASGMGGDGSAGELSSTRGALGWEMKRTEEAGSAGELPSTIGALGWGLKRMEKAGSAGELPSTMGALGWEKKRTEKAGSAGELPSTMGEPLLVIIDEAHHCTAKTYRRLWEAFPKARFLGMTATPCRLKQEGFTELFDRLICSEPIARFMHEGWLANYEYISIRTDSETQKIIQRLKKRGVDGDYQTKEMEEVFGTRASIEQLYRSYKKYADGKKGIIYAINREHAHKIAAYYAGAMTQGAEGSAGELPSTRGTLGWEMMKADGTGSAGELPSTRGALGWEMKRTEEAGSTGKLPSTEGTLGWDTSGMVAVVDSETPREERERINREYREGKIRILVNCEIYGEGYDAPFVEFIQLARPTLSLSKYLQQVGRGLRPNKNGEQTVILDNVGMYYRFGLPHDNRDWDRMFKYGQMDDVQEMKKRVYIQGNKERKQSNHTEIDITDGHNLEMVTIAGAYDVQEALDVKFSETVVFEVNGKFGLRRGKTIVLMPVHDKIGRFVGGYALVDGRFFVSEYGDTYTLNHLERVCEVCEGGFIHVSGGSYKDLIYAGSYKELPSEVMMFEGFIPLVRIGDLYYLRTHSTEIAFRKEDLWIKGNGFQRRNALNPKQSIYMNRLTGNKVFVFAGYYSDGKKKVRDYEGGMYYRVEAGGVPVWDGGAVVPIDDIEYRIYERNMASEQAYRESFRMKKIKGIY